MVDQIPIGSMRHIYLHVVDLPVNFIDICVNVGKEWQIYHT